MTKLIVVKEHNSGFPNPISFSKGESLVVGKRDTEFENWVWVTTKNGNEGWAPIQYLQTEEDNKGVAKQDYEARELDTCLGDELLLHYELNNWGWVEKSDGSTGWVPMNTTTPA